ncbi:tripartite ATP-independent transporter DctM subunit [Stella humosa]|uniref:TRAP transporter large permease protein n=1 Tax=Stella humosa TaxID=94 RepID=A0A3N1KWH0_9PROT|nr:TRAP transporter large permease [Stella humosa]ROP83782.1 tripartite ATP-independent transporter DctM subunit [Stella humosa]
MSSLTIGYLSMPMLIVLLLLRVPIGVALSLIAFVGLAIIANMRVAFSLLTTVPFELIGDWSLSAVPMFMLMGYICTETGLTTNLFRAARVFLAGMPGGLAVSSVAACTLFAAASGSSVATAAGMSRIAVPEMLRHRYDPGLAAGCVASAGTLGSLIPPSILMVVYAVFAGVSVSKLFVAGILPGLLSALMFSLMIVVRVKLKPSLAPDMEHRPTMAERVSAVRDAWPLPVLIVGVLGGIYSGWCTPTEAGAIGAALAVLIAMLRRQLRTKALGDAVRLAAEGTASLFIIAVGAGLYARFLGLTGVPGSLTGLLVGAEASPLLVVLIICAVYLLLGCFIDSIGIMLLTAPIMIPILQQVGIDLIWFGIIVVKLLEIGLVTPPVGLNVFVIKSTLGNAVSLTTIFRGAFWFIATDLVTLALLISFPMIALYLPSFMN